MPDRHPPFWVTLIIVIVALPLLALPILLNMAAPQAGVVRALIWIYPFYMLLSAWLAYKAWAGKPDVTWILITVMLLSTAAIFLLAHNSDFL